MDPLPEEFLSHELFKHTEHAGPLGVRDRVEDLGDLVRVGDLLDDGVRVDRGVEGHHPVKIHRQELRLHLPVRVVVGNSLKIGIFLLSNPNTNLVFHVGSKAFIEP